MIAPDIAVGLVLAGVTGLSSTLAFPDLPDRAFRGVITLGTLGIVVGGGLLFACAMGWVAS